MGWRGGRVALLPLVGALVAGCSGSPPKSLPPPDAVWADPGPTKKATLGTDPKTETQSPRSRDDVSRDLPGIDSPPETPKWTQPRTLSREERRKIVDGYLRRMRSDRSAANQAYRELTRVRADLIPDLIAEVQNPQRSQVYELKIIALHDNVAVLDEDSGVLYYNVQGMGRFEFDTVTLGKGTLGKRRRDGTRVIYRNISDGFPLGVVIRAALLQRLKSSRYPAFDDDTELVRWWQEYYRRARAAN